MRPEHEALRNTCMTKFRDNIFVQHGCPSRAYALSSALSPGPVHRPTHLTMTMLQQRVSKRSLDFPNQQKAYLLRKVDGLSWSTIASKVENIAGGHPVWGTVRNIVRQRRPQFPSKCIVAWSLTSPYPSHHDHVAAARLEAQSRLSEPAEGAYSIKLYIPLPG